jgi:hypothetical protein
MALTGFLVIGCSETSAKEAPSAPSKTEAIQGSSLKKVILTESAATRLALAMGEVTEEPQGLRGEPGPRKAVPYAAVIYDLEGKTWVYERPAELTFVRSPIVIDYVASDKAVLHEGPAAGTKVVTVGVAELYGAETGVK